VLDFGADKPRDFIRQASGVIADRRLKPPVKLTDGHFLRGEYRNGLLRLVPRDFLPLGRGEREHNRTDVALAPAY